MKCPVCLGDGVTKNHNPTTGEYDVKKMCPVCNGTGEIRQRANQSRNAPYKQVGIHEILDDGPIMDPPSRRKPDFEVKDDPTYPWSPKS